MAWKQIFLRTHHHQQQNSVVFFPFTLHLQLLLLLVFLPRHFMRRILNGWKKEREKKKRLAANSRAQLNDFSVYIHVTIVVPCSVCEIHCKRTQRLCCRADEMSRETAMILVKSNPYQKFPLARNYTHSCWCCAQGSRIHVRLCKMLLALDAATAPTFISTWSSFIFSSFSTSFFSPALCF